MQMNVRRQGAIKPLGHPCSAVVCGDTTGARQAGCRGGCHPCAQCQFPVPVSVCPLTAEGLLRETKTCSGLWSSWWGTAGGNLRLHSWERPPPCSLPRLPRPQPPWGLAGSAGLGHSLDRTSADLTLEASAPSTVSRSRGGGAGPWGAVRLPQPQNGTRGRRQERSAKYSASRLCLSPPHGPLSRSKQNFSNRTLSSSPCPWIIFFQSATSSHLPTCSDLFLRSSLFGTKNVRSVTTLTHLVFL